MSAGIIEVEDVAVIVTRVPVWMLCIVAVAASLLRWMQCFFLSSDTFDNPYCTLSVMVKPSFVEKSFSTGMKPASGRRKSTGPQR